MGRGDKAAARYLFGEQKVWALNATCPIILSSTSPLRGRVNRPTYTSDSVLVPLKLEGSDIFVLIYMEALRTKEISKLG